MTPAKVIPMSKPKRAARPKKNKLKEFLIEGFAFGSGFYIAGGIIELIGKLFAKLLGLS